MSEKMRSKDMTDQYIAYPKALKLLTESLNATPEEIAAWVWMGPENGGLSAFLNANELDSPPRFRYDLGDGDFDYISPLMACWFHADDIANFEPSDRYITGKALLKRWKKQPGIKAKSFIRARISESRLQDIHPIFGGTQGTFSGDDTFPPLKSGLFVLCDVEKIEAEDFSDDSVSVEEEFREHLPRKDSQDLELQKPEKDRKQDKNTDFSDELASAFDPLLLSGIAKMFPVVKGDEQANIKKWKNLASKASVNGLDKAKTKKGRGRAQSLFDPFKVSEWLLTKKYGYTQEMAYRKLAKNLPPRSADLKEVILGYI
jgi:hypothetical protein